MKPVSKARARKIANSLLRQNKVNSWRDLSKTYGIAAGTLNRFANSHGAWLPKDEGILQKLGLVTVRSPYAVMPRWWKRTPEALQNFKYIRNQARVIANETHEQQFAYKKVKHDKV
jgi:hypothetical protein